MQNLRFCPKCGAPLRPGATSCANCGAAIGLTGTMRRVGETPSYVAPMIKQWHERHMVASDSLKVQTRGMRIVLLILSIVALITGFFILSNDIFTLPARTGILFPVLAPFLKIGIAALPLCCGFSSLLAAFFFKVKEHYYRIPLASAVVFLLCILLALVCHMLLATDAFLLILAIGTSAAILHIERILRTSSLLRYQ